MGVFLKSNFMSLPCFYFNITLSVKFGFGIKLNFYSIL